MKYIVDEFAEKINISLFYTLWERDTNYRKTKRNGEKKWKKIG